MAIATTAPGRWSQLDGKRSSLIKRTEKYAGFTISKLCTPDGYDQNTDELQHDFQAVGAQAVNHLANKIMLALFAPSRPFFRLDPSVKLRQQLKEAGVDETKLTEMLALGEKEAISELDRLSLRPKLYEAIKHLIVCGNVLMILEDETRVIGLKNYCVRRSQTGRILEILHRDKLTFDELIEDIQITMMYADKTYESKPDKEVCLYRWITRLPNGNYHVEQWVDKHQLPPEFSATYTPDQLPYRVLTWDLSDDAHYGTGLVEDYQGDFAGLSTLSKSQVMAAVLCSEFRWLVNPAGMTSPDDLMNSDNGAALPGNKDDINLIQSGKAGDMQIVQAIGQEYVQRIGRGFLLGSAVTRDAERVTAEEIRMQATELETSLGGAYSRLAVDFQVPLSYYLLDRIDFKINGTEVRPSIVTGLDALSRNGDLENLKLWLADMAGLAALPPTLQGSLKMTEISRTLASARRIEVDKYMKSPEEIKQEQQQMLMMQAQAQAAAKGIDTAGNVAEAQATQGM
ncbi:head-to-tail connector protein [Caulobacter phage BL198]|uniref:Head-to-tail connector protein n=1 Tax=Caulobacter phage BL198 TaxID=3020395 RepID=A0AAE9WYY5_9CAUD|nr:head-to-tail connector protein [Caulobacter phage BL198]